MSWVLMIIAILLEVSGTTMMKLSQGFTRRLPTILMFGFYGIGFIPLTLALQRLPISVAYTVWSGLGTAIITAIGILWFREPLTAVKLISITLIIIGVVGLNLSGVH
jgi:small multidrug resistance pump